MLALRTALTAPSAARTRAPQYLSVRQSRQPQWCQQRAASATHTAAAAATSGGDPPAAEDEPQGLLPEEDAQIPGGYRDAMSSNTPLGKAVRGVCEELDTLGGLERQTLEEAEALLKQLGFKGSLFAGQQQQQQQQQQQPDGGTAADEAA
ncbi:hypothetical protein C2E20_7059 [Micractinium conductrix]|uniref:Uncharacterized protein n=1 Tax=Micractinium conductrix TaxID=554055 RepID=A0A2P6V5R9_9CHLO|nr:hypothetical protein C2E20_7059 [Micractinium conductrix]|eukprot:PSC69426.1 hypothetical protein C2E20_7059 [Micractinium conductrix]